MFCFSPSAIVLPALHNFFYRQWNKRNYPLHFWNVFHFLTRKNSLRKTFLLECVRSGAQQAARKGGNFGAKLTHLCGFWLDVSFFSHVKKTSFAILIGRIIFFTRENHISLIWSARTHLWIKIYNTTLWWVFLSMYIR